MILLFGIPISQQILVGVAVAVTLSVFYYLSIVIRHSIDTVSLKKTTWSFAAKNILKTHPIFSGVVIFYFFGLILALVTSIIEAR